MSADPKTKSVDAVYTDAVTYLETALEPLSPVARGMLIASLKRHLVKIERTRRDTLDRIEKV